MAKSPKGSNAASATVHDQELGRGAGGELHQFAQGETPALITAQDGPVSDDQWRREPTVKMR